MSIALRGLGVVGASALTLFGLSAPTAAAEPEWEVVFEAGQVCAFPLVVAGSGAGARVYREFLNQDGTVRTLSAGTGFELTYTNQQTGESFSSRPNGAVTRAVIRADGSSTQTLTGHNVVFMFPTDVPGPSATLYTGQVVIDVASDGTWTLVHASGKALDICATLAPGS